MVISMKLIQCMNSMEIYWHGNPTKYRQDQIHPNYKPLTYGDLYRKTLQRDQKIRDLGYNLVTKWETEFISEMKELGIDI